MEETKLIRLIKTMNKQQFKRFRLFVESTLYNKNSKYISLLNFIAKSYPKFNPSNFSEKKAYAYVYPNEAPRKGAITKILSKLFGLLTNFLATEQRLESGFDIEFNLLQEYQKRGMNNDFERLSQKLLSQKKAIKKGITNTDYYHQFLLEKEINHVISTQRDRGIGDAGYLNTHKALDIYYFYTKLIYTCQVINRSIVIKGMQVDPLSLEIVEMIPKTEYINEPVIKIWYSAYQMLIKEDKFEDYYDLKKNLYSNPDILIKTELRILCTYLENIAVRIFKSKNALFEEVYELYNFQLEQGTLLHDKTLIPGIIKNYLSVSLNLGKTEKAAEFLENIKDQVVPIYPDSYKFCSAMLLFNQSAFEDALSLLNEINFSNVIMKLNERDMRLRIYYHLDYMDLLNDTLNSFRVFLTYNNEILSDRLLDANRRFSNYLGKIIKPQTAESSSELYETILADHKTIHKKWLLEQIKTK